MAKMKTKATSGVTIRLPVATIEKAEQLRAFISEHSRIVKSWNVNVGGHPTRDDLERCEWLRTEMSLLEFEITRSIVHSLTPEGDES
jgi:hypothetical protein